MKIIQTGMNLARKISLFIGSTALVGMMIITCIDVVGRYFKHPIFGSVEITGYLAALAIAMSLSNTHEKNGHIGVEIFIRRLSKTKQGFIEILTNLIGIVLCGVITWQMFKFAKTVQASGEVSMNLKVPEHIIIYIFTLCFTILFLTMIGEVIHNFKRLVSDQ